MKDVTLDEMKEIVTSGDTVLVDVWATWCGPCKRMAPILEEVDAMLDDVTVVKLDADKNPIDELSVVGVPTLILYKNGAEVKRTTGAIPKLKLLSFIQD